ncbi:MAG: hypothetical protein Q8909_01430 [Bacteroidota bacterium]|nr:hypothetical protein [Bacteroidota bacterium]
MITCKEGIIFEWNNPDRIYANITQFPEFKSFYINLNMPVLLYPMNFSEEKIFCYGRSKKNQ